MIASRAGEPPVLLDVSPAGWLDPIPRCQLCGGVLEAYADALRLARRCDRCGQRWVALSWTRLAQRLSPNSRGGSSYRCGGASLASAAGTARRCPPN